MNQTANSGVRENKLSNNIQQSSSMTMPGNPDVKFPPQSGNAVPYSENGKITGWKTIPEGNSIVVAIGGQINFIPINEPGIVIVQGGQITILPIGTGIMVGNGTSVEFKAIGSGVMVGEGGTSISYKSGPGSDYLFNGDYGWTGTTECT